MIYSVEFPVPPETPRTNPARIDLQIGAGHILGFNVLFPAGCLGAVGVRLLDRDSQIAPLGSGWVIDENKSVGWSEDRRLTGPPYLLRAEAFNEAIDYSHSLNIRVIVTHV